MVWPFKTKQEQAPTTERAAYELKLLRRAQRARLAGDTKLAKKLLARAAR